ncbi:Ribosomal RNA processing protein 36 [Thelohanellus kitauei]|uniref:rRNA biogenesis protein RRP36 n=1 Tax=Thelohanellus kitauei TaxID=669202 RepID=A0A0C2MFS5_THEKT|nr:Ribosomal RNA processing protein 36 [Thelohanellus kitauei]
MENEKPREMSVKVQVCANRPAFKVRKTARDPRFDDRCGKFSAKIFEQNYGFVDQIKEKEINMVEKQIRRSKKNADTTDLKKLHHSLVQQKLRRDEQKKKHEQLEFIKQKRKESAFKSKTNVLFKKNFKKKLELVDKFKDLKKTGKLKSYIERKRKQKARKNENVVD